MLFLFCCHSDEIEIDNKYIETVSIEESLDFLNNYYSVKSSSNFRTSSYQLLFDTDNTRKEVLRNSEEKITVIPTQIAGKNFASRTLLIRINDTIRSSVIFMIPEGNNSTKKFTGRIYFSALEGNYLNAYRVKNNKLIARLLPKEKNNNDNRISSTSATNCPYSDSSLCDLDEVVIIVESDDEPDVFFIDIGFPYGRDTSNDPELENVDWNAEGGGGSSETTCQDGYEKDANGNCVKCPDGEVLDRTGNCVKKPCSGDPVSNPEIAPQTNSGIQGGMHGTCARKQSSSVCNGIRGRKKHIGVDIKNPY